MCVCVCMCMCVCMSVCYAIISFRLTSTAPISESCVQEKLMQLETTSLPRIAILYLFLSTSTMYLALHVWQSKIEMGPRH